VFIGQVWQGVAQVIYGQSPSGCVVIIAPLSWDSLGGHPTSLHPYTHAQGPAIAISETWTGVGFGGALNPCRCPNDCLGTQILPEGLLWEVVPQQVTL
jgi:hypothetical protein